MTSASEPLPSDLAAAHAIIIAERAARLAAESDRSSAAALIAHLKLEIEKLRRQLYGTRSERKARLLDQLELQLEELEANATEDELAAEKAAARTQTVNRSNASDLRANPFPTTFSASVSSSRPRRAARAVVGAGCRSWARTRPRRWR